jgi:hypothetical protein
LKLLVDNNLPPALARSLDALFAPEDHIIHIIDKFGTGNLPDEEWIESLAQESSWSVLSADIRIAKKRPSRELFLRSNLVGFFLAPSMDKYPVHEKAARLLMQWKDLRAIANSMQRGVFEVPVRGKLRGL